MPAYLRDALDRAANTYPEADRSKLERALREAFAAIGMDVNHQTGEVYNQAEGAYRSPVRTVPRDQRFATRRR